MYFFLSKILAPFLNITNFLVIFILFSYFLKSFFFKKTLKVLNQIAIFLIIFFGFSPIGNSLVYTLEKDYIKSNIQNDYKYIIVLAGSEDLYGSLISKKVNLGSSSERLIAGAKLVNQNENSKIIFLGGNGLLFNKTNLNESDVARNFFLDINLNLEKVIFINNSRNTIENLKELKKLNLVTKNNSVIVTSAFHMKRVLLISEKLDLDLTPYAVDFRSLSSSGAGFINFYQMFNFAGNLQSLNLYFREFVGIIAVKILM